MTQTPESTEV